MSTQESEALQKDEHSKEEKFLGISHVVERPSQVKDKDEEPPEIEIIDERDPEDQRPAVKLDDEKPEGDDDDIGEYSERVQKRIKKLTWQQNEERRQREAAERERDESIRVSKTLLQQKQQYEQIIAQGEGELVNRIKTGAQIAVDAAKAEYRKAYDEGDTDAIIAAQERQVQALSELREANNYERDYQQRAQRWAQQQQYQQYRQPAQQQTQQPVQQRQPAQPDPEAAAWAKKNTWFGTHKDARRDMTAIAYAKHESLIRDEGYTPNSPEYYAEIDKEVRVRFPEYFGEGQRSSRSTSPSPTTVVAPASRANGARPRKVKLTTSQVSIAKSLGLTTEQYANQLLKDMENG